MNLTDFAGYSTGRFIAKILLVLNAIAVSTFALQGFILRYLQYDFFIPVRDWLAIFSILLIFLIKEGKITPPRIKFLSERKYTNWVYFILVGVVILGVSSYSLDFIANFLNLHFLSYDALSIRNAFAVGFLISAWVIHGEG